MDDNDVDENYDDLLVIATVRVISDHSSDGKDKNRW